jgi:hypothetical protein
LAAWTTGVMEYWRKVFKSILHHSNTPSFCLIKDRLLDYLKLFDENLKREGKRICPRPEYGLTD